MDQARNTTDGYPDSPRWRASRSTCHGSPHCYLPTSITGQLAGTDGLWLHYGPIAKDTTPLMVHRAERAPGARNTGALEAETLRTQSPFTGAHLDLYCLDRNPGGEAQRHAQRLGGTRSVVWAIFAVAWRDEGLLHVSWVAPGLGLAIQGFNTFYGTDHPGAAHLEEASRLMDLLAGRGRRRGRPPRWRDPFWRDIVAEGEARKAAHPRIPIDDIARALGVSPTTYRAYQKLADRERDHEVHLLEGGGA